MNIHILKSINIYNIAKSLRENGRQEALRNFNIEIFNIMKNTIYDEQ